MILRILFVLFVLLVPTRMAALNVYTYESFVSEWGPGPALEEAFEARCSCDITWTSVGDAAVLLSRLRLEGAESEADVVLGLDTNLMHDAVELGLVSEHDLQLSSLDLPIEWDDPNFVPFDYGYFALVYDSLQMPEPPGSLEELFSQDGEDDLIIQDPRTSTPGLGLMLWIKAVYGDDAGEKWEQLSTRILTVTKGWSEAYGLFLQGEAPMVLSYTTSPAYHLMVENETRYRAAIFPEGHYMQVELAAIAAHTTKRDQARDFLQFITTPKFQKLIPTTNWMYPVVNLGDDLPEEFRDLERPERSLLLSAEEVGTKRKSWIQEWLDALTK